MKYLVETLGDFGLVDVFGGQDVSAYRPSVVKATPFIEAQSGRKLRILDQLSDAATDEMLATADDLEVAIKALPRPNPNDPLDHDGDGRKGGSLPGNRRKK